MATTERQRLINLHTSKPAQLPDAEDLDHGEIAVRYNTDNPELIIKRADDSLVSFKPNSVKIYQASSGGVAPGSATTCNVTDANVLSYYDGLSVMLKLGYAPDSENGLDLQINSLGYKPVEYSDGTLVGGEWVSGDEIMLVYNGSMEDSTGAWQVVNSKKSSSVVVRTWESTQENPDYLCFTANKAGATLRMAGEYDGNYTGEDFALEYSTDGETWSELVFTKGTPVEGGDDVPCTSETLVFQSVGDKVYLRGDNTKGTYNGDFNGSLFDYGFVFRGGENTQALDNEFTVTGDIQTIVDKTGKNKNSGCYYMLFTWDDDEVGDNDVAITVTSAPDLTANVLTDYCYCGMFTNQPLLRHPARTPVITNEMLPLVNFETGEYGGAFMNTYYGCESLEEMMDLSGIVLDSDSSVEEFQKLVNFASIIEGTYFNVTDDNGETLNFGCGIDFPLEVDGGILDEFILCANLGNVNGFDLAHVHYKTTGGESSSVSFYTPNSAYGGHSDDYGDYIIQIPTGESISFTLTATPGEAYQFVKWQYSPDGQEYTDISGATDTTYNTVLVQPGDYYYKGVFAENPDYLCFTANKAGATLRMTGIESLGFSGDSFSLEYSTDGDTWQDLNFTSSGSPEEGLVTRVSDTLTFDSVGDKVYFRGDNPSGTTTADALFGSSDIGYYYIFAGGENTETVDNEFSVGGDIQTIVDKTGLNKTAGCFYSLFAAGDDRDLYPGMILITSAPDLTATVLTDHCYFVMFVHQTLLSHPAEFPVLTFDSLSGTSYMLGEMYLSCYGLLEPANLNSLVFSGYSDLQRCYYNLNGIYGNNTFDITEDNGASIAGFGGLVFPYELNVSGDTLSVSSANFAGLVGNYNGFDTVKVVFNTDSQSYGSIYFNVDESLVIRGGGSNYLVPNILWLQDGGNVPITVTASPEQGYHFVKWQSSSDGDTWTDIQGATNPVYSETLTAVGNYYYKPVFESDN